MARSKKTVEKTAAKKPEEKTVAKRRGRPSQASASAAPSSGTSSVSRLRALYVDLASDLDKLSAFVADPHAFAEQTGLSEEETELLFSGDQGKIYASLRPEMIPMPVPQPVPMPPQPQPSTPEAGAATQAAAPAPAPPSPGYPCASQWPMTYAYGWPGYWPSSQGSFVQTTSSCPAEQPPEQKGEANV